MFQQILSETLLELRQWERWMSRPLPPPILSYVSNAQKCRCRKSKTNTAPMKRARAPPVRVKHKSIPIIKGNSIVVN